MSKESTNTIALPARDHRALVARARAHSRVLRDAGAAAIRRDTVPLSSEEIAEKPRSGDPFFATRRPQRRGSREPLRPAERQRWFDAAGDDGAARILAKQSDARRHLHSCAKGLETVFKSPFGRQRLRSDPPPSHEGHGVLCHDP